jgi:hypothetical protein
MKNLFDDPNFREASKRNAALTRERIAQLRCPNTLSAGDSFVFTESYDLPVRWVCVFAHVDNPLLWFLVAADEYHQVGTCDIELPESHPLAPLALRCKVGFWAHRDDLNMNEYLGNLEGDFVLDARYRLSEMVLGKVPITEHGLIAEANDEYSDWLAELMEVAERIESRLQAEPVVLANATFDLAWSRDPMVEMRHSETASLAADGFGAQKPIQLPPATRLPSKLPGRLLLQRDEDTYDLVYYPSPNNETPPKLTFANILDVRTGDWKRGADGVWTWSQPLGVKNSEVLLILGVERFKIHIV